MRRLLIASTVLALAFAVPASAAQAASLRFFAPCYAAIPGRGADQPLGFAITGGTPGLNWTVTSDVNSGIFGTDVRGTFDGTGTAFGQISSYTINRLGISASRGRQGLFTLKQGPSLFGQTPIAQAPVTATNATVDISSSRGSAFRKRTWKISGIKPLYGSSATYYGTWVKGGTSGKTVVKRAKLGTSKGACGYLSFKRVLPPARRSGAYTVFVHQGKKLNKKKAIAFPFRVFIF